MCTSGGGAGIGSGDSSIGSTTIAECGDIHITGLYTKVIATTENPSNSDDIGRGNRSYCGVVNIDGGANVTATNNKIYEF